MTRLWPVLDVLGFALLGGLGAVLVVVFVAVFSFGVTLFANYCDNLLRKRGWDRETIADVGIFMAVMSLGAVLTAIVRTSWWLSH